MISKSSKGFSLIELLVVVGIVGILAAIGTVSYQGYVKSSKRTAAQNIVQQTALAQTEEYSNAGSYILTEALGDGAAIRTAECEASSASSDAIEDSQPKDVSEDNNYKSNKIWNVCCGKYFYI